MKEPANAKKARLAAEACGFECFTGESMVHVEATPWASDGVNSKGVAHKKGEARFPAKDLEAWVLRGRHLAIPDELAFEVIWADGFHTARVIDPTGKEKELWVDYSYTAEDAKRYGYSPEYAEKMLQERNYAYNDGEVYRIPKWRMSTWGEFTEWIDGLIGALRVNYPTISAKKKEPKPAPSLMDDFKKKEWIG